MAAGGFAHVRITSGCSADVRETLCRVAMGPLSNLIVGLKSGDAPLLSGSAEQLAGLGVGLTQLGDDVLIGIAGALSLPEARLPLHKGFTRLSNAVVSAAEGQTNAIAFTY